MGAAFTVKPKWSDVLLHGCDTEGLTLARIGAAFLMSEASASRAINAGALEPVRERVNNALLPGVLPGNVQDNLLCVLLDGTCYRVSRGDPDRTRRPLDSSIDGSIAAMGAIAQLAHDLREAVRDRVITAGEATAIRDQINDTRRLLDEIEVTIGQHTART